MSEGEEEEEGRPGVGGRPGMMSDACRRRTPGGGVVVVGGVEGTALRVPELGEGPLPVQVG